MKALNTDAEIDELAALISHCALKNQRAFKTLYDKAAPTLYAMLMRLLKHQEAAEEMLQESFIQIWQNAQSYHSARGEPMAWMISIARYRAMDFKRKHRTTNALPDNEHIDTLLQTQLNDLLEYCFKQLDKTSRQILLMSYHEGYSHNELASYLTQPLGTVKSWIRRGFIKLKHCLDSE